MKLDFDPVTALYLWSSQNTLTVQLFPSRKYSLGLMSLEVKDFDKDMDMIVDIAL